MDNSVSYADQSAKQADRKPGNVSALMDQLSAAQAELGERVELLGDRLGGVLRPGEPEADNRTEPEQGYRSNLAAQIQQRIDITGRTLSLVMDLFERVDL